jgi:hypothetical protein
MYPIMIGAATQTGAPDKITGVHRTFLRPDGGDKADLPDEDVARSGSWRRCSARADGPKLAVSEGDRDGT